MASERKWTPGPWIWGAEFTGLYGAGKDNAVLDYEPYEGMWIADYTPQGEANAHLIAAAPDMYEALYRAVKQLEDHGFDGLSCGGYAALAKARGES